MNLALASSPTERRLRDRIDELEEEVRQLKDGKSGIVFPSEWRLTAANSRALQALYQAPHGLLSNTQIFNAVRLWADGGDEYALVRVQVHKMRKKLTPFGVEIKLRWGQGYELPANSKAIIKAALTQEVSA